MNKSLNGANSPEEAPDYAVLNSQITYKWKNFDFYVGGENLTNYMMHHPIEYANDPYHKNFNAGNVWGPIAVAWYIQESDGEQAKKNQRINPAFLLHILIACLLNQIYHSSNKKNWEALGFIKQNLLFLIQQKKIQ